MNTFLHSASNEIWAMEPARLRSFLSMLAADSPASARAQQRKPVVQGKVAVLPIHGVISQRAGLWQDVFGGTSTQQLAAAYAKALNDDSVAAIVFDVDSPGGTVAGVEEASAMIREGSRLKPTYAVANSLAASAGYWLASQVGPGRLFAAPGADVGSIGVYVAHEDVSGMLDKRGVKVTLVGTPARKTEGNPYEPLSSEAKAYYENRIADTYERFVSDVAAGRNVTTSRVKTSYGGGRVVESRAAQAAGMVDGIRTLPEVVVMAAGGPGRVSSAGSFVAKMAEDGLIRAWDSGMVEHVAGLGSDIGRRRRELDRLAAAGGPGRTASERRAYLDRCEREVEQARYLSRVSG